MEMKATIDQLEDSEYIRVLEDVNKRLETRYNNPPQINLNP